MREFKYYLDKGVVKKVSKDLELAKSLRNNLIKRAEKINKLDIDEYSTIIFENLYDCLREICDSLLALDGYKSYSHEAAIIYLKKYGYSLDFIQELDNFRFKRNSSKYYGGEILKANSEDIKKFYFSNIKKLLKLIEDKIEGVENE